MFVLYVRHDPAALWHTGGDYLSFMALLASLFVVSGGVLVTGDIQARPAVNTAFLAVGAVLASLVGTTGASVLLIRPLLATNEERRHVAHTVVFFIFVVSNIGGRLTPLGDPPCSSGISSASRSPDAAPGSALAPGQRVGAGRLLRLGSPRLRTREDAAAIARDETAVRPIRVAGRRNIALLLAVVASVAFLHAPLPGAGHAGRLRVSLAFTPARCGGEPVHLPRHRGGGRAVRGHLPHHAPGARCPARPRTEPGPHVSPGISSGAAGLLSPFLDNAPTYLTFVAIAQSLGLPPEVAGMSHRVLAAISAGAVFMGANTYIGNGPNFMVRSMAEERGVKMPSFGGYMLYSGRC